MNPTHLTYNLEVDLIKKESTRHYLSLIIAGVIIASFIYLAIIINIKYLLLMLGCISFFASCIFLVKTFNNVLYRYSFPHTEMVEIDDQLIDDWQ